MKFPVNRRALERFPVYFLITGHTYRHKFITGWGGKVEKPEKCGSCYFAVNAQCVVPSDQKGLCDISAPIEEFTKRSSQEDSSDSSANKKSPRLKYKDLYNPKTRQTCLIPAGRYGNFLTAIKKLIQFVRYNFPKYYIVHLTLTLAENTAEIHHKHLHRVLQFIDKRINRAGGDFKYVAVKEQQERGAIHYHILCVYNKPYTFPSPAEIETSWGLGFIKVTAPKFKLKMRLKSVAGYIGKYIGKGYDYEALNYRKSFSASQIKQIYKLTEKRLAAVIERFGKDQAEAFKCSYRKVYDVITCKPFRPLKKLMMEFPSDWQYVGNYVDPF